MIEKLIEQFKKYLDPNFGLYNDHTDYLTGVHRVVSLVMEKHGIKIADSFAEAISEKYNIEVYIPSKVLKALGVVVNE